MTTLSLSIKDSKNLYVVFGWLIAVFLIGAGIIATGNVYSQVYLVGYPGLHPNTASPGGPGFVLLVSGTNVLSNSSVHWNGSRRETVGFAQGHLQVQILASDIAHPGTAKVTVYTPDFGYSPEAIFTIAAPPPFLGHLVPNSIPAEGPGFVLMAIGTCSYSGAISPFTSNSVIRWNGSNRETTFIDPQRLQATILAGDVALPGTAMITVSDADGNTSDAQLFTIKEPHPTVNLSIHEGGAAQHQTPGISEQTQTGYATATNSGIVPNGTAVFSFKIQDVTVSEVAVAPSPLTFNARFFVDYRRGALAVPGRPESGNIDINTGFGVVNHGERVASVTYLLRDSEGGTVALGYADLPAGYHDTRFINQLIDVAPDFDFPEDFASIYQFGSLEIQSDQPLSVLALRGTNNQINDFVMTTTPIADVNQTPGTNTIYFPQLADGGGYTTSLILMNTSDQTETGSLEILNNEGSTMSVTQAGGSTSSSFRYSIKAGGTYRFQTDGSPADTKVGWARLIPDALSYTPVGLGIFSYNPGNRLISESGIPASTPVASARVYVDIAGKHNTAFGLVNPNGTAQAIQVRAYQMDGTSSVGTTPDPLQLNALGHVAIFANQLIQDLPPDFKGILDISSSNPFVIMTMRSLNNERNDFLMASFPVADPSRRTIAPLLFPHIADGGGYTTEFIFFSPGGASTISLGLADSTGMPFSPAE